MSVVKQLKEILNVTSLSLSNLNAVITDGREKE
jgi:hypothetical protein